jgi:hypothetical protein
MNFMIIYWFTNIFWYSSLLKSITKSFTKVVNINRIYNELKSQQVKIWLSTLHQYWKYIKNVFYVYELENFYNNKALKKWFLYNIWFGKLLFDKEKDLKLQDYIDFVSFNEMKI